MLYGDIGARLSGGDGGGGGGGSTELIEGFEHNDLATNYLEGDAGDLNSFEIQTNIVRSGSYALRVIPGQSSTQTISTDPAQFDNLPTDPASWRVYFYVDGTSGEDRRVLHHWAADSGSPKSDGAYFWRLRNDDIALVLYDKTGDRTTLVYEPIAYSDLPNNQMNYVDIYWHEVGGPVENEDQVGFEVFDGSDDSLVMSEAATDTTYKDSGRELVGHTSLHDIPTATIIDDIQYE